MQDALKDINDRLNVEDFGLVKPGDGIRTLPQLNADPYNTKEQQREAVEIAIQSFDDGQRLYSTQRCAGYSPESLWIIHLFHYRKRKVPIDKNHAVSYWMRLAAPANNSHVDYPVFSGTLRSNYHIYSDVCSRSFPP